MKIQMKINDEEVVGIYPRGPNTVLFVTTNNHYLMDRTRNDTWKIQDGNNKK